MASEVVTFAKNYDHVWPSRAMTAYKAGMTKRVKAEVAAAARLKGALTSEAPPTREQLVALAESLGVDVGAIEGSGAKGYVTVDDLQRAIEHAGETDAEPIGAAPSGAEAPTE